MPAVTRELSIVYGGTTVGGATDRLLDGYYRLQRDYGLATLEFEFVTTAVTEAAFQAEIAALETAFRTPRQRLRVLLGAQVLDDLNPAADPVTGYNAAPMIEKAGEEDDTGRSRRYHVRIVVEVPADLAGQAGRRNSFVELAFSPARRRRLTIQGTYTALGANRARAQYNASIAAYVATLTAALGGTWERVEETAAADDDDRNLTFQIVYEELLLNQDASTLDNLDVVRQTMFVSRTYVAPGDVTGTDRLSTVVVDYESWLDKDRTTDLAGRWTTVIRPWVIRHALALSGAGSGALVEEFVRFNAVENSLSATLTFLARGTSAILQAALSQEDALDHGVAAVPLWSGSVHEKALFQGPATLTRVIVETRRLLGGASDDGATWPALKFKDKPGKKKKKQAGVFVVLRETYSAAPVRLGRGTNVLDVTDETRTTSLLYVEEPTS